MQLNGVVPLGRTFTEYQAMFSLNKADLNKNILDCGGGPSSFNYEMKMQNKEVITIDPLYQFSKEDIKKRIDETFNDVMAQAKANQDNYIWKNIKTVEELAETRMSAMKLFLNDFETGKNDKRYINAALPDLPFKKEEFDLALSSHFLFLYSDMLSLDFHISAVDEMLRVAREVRIFPLLDLSTDKSQHVEEIIRIFKEKEMQVSIETVNYEFQKGGNQLMRICKN
ncbi:SAM-dependent methyltransferase [Methanobacterium sp. MBAC-LM]|uniref:SAM-dependent methyltransferase n=1 Tax=Methanobacterium sp. MBAC-LM TaxID=3412034 RepID=UPI003C73D72F